METPPLAPVYLDNEPVPLPAEPRPRVAQVAAAAGKPPDRFAILRLDGPGGAVGVQVGPDEVLDRTLDPAQAIHLAAVARAAPVAAPAGGSRAFGQGPHGVEGLSPGVSGEGNEAGSLQSAYSRTGTDTAGPGMAEQEARRRMAAGLEDPFGKEGLSGKVDGEPSGLGATRPVRAHGDTDDGEPSA
ncbi:MAG TPA: hypothetical protein VHI93_07975 [Candidatus Thermoplasmatota archaeon]|nr:hypothetical protein [Candidatus Thermoplasmatota archaeon]